MTEVNNNPLFREAGLAAESRVPRACAKAREAVIDRRSRCGTGFYERNDVPIVHGAARFVDPHTIEVEDAGGAAAAAARRRRSSSPPDPGRIARRTSISTHPRIFDSDTILDLERTPQSITIYGAGVVGCEYTSMFRNLDMQGEPGQHAVASCSSSSTTRSSTR